MSIVYDDKENRYRHYCHDNEPDGDDTGEENCYWRDGEGWFLAPARPWRPFTCAYCPYCGEGLVSSPQKMYDWDSAEAIVMEGRPVGVSAAFLFTKSQSDLMFALQRKMRQRRSNLSWTEFGARMLAALAKEEGVDEATLGAADL